MGDATVTMAFFRPPPASVEGRWRAKKCRGSAAGPERSPRAALRRPALDDRAAQIQVAQAMLTEPQLQHPVGPRRPQPDRLAAQRLRHPVVAAAVAEPAALLHLAHHV